MPKKKSKKNFSVKRASEYYSATENSFPQDSQRLSERGVRPDVDSQTATTFGFTKKNKKR